MGISPTPSYTIQIVVPRTALLVPCDVRHDELWSSQVFHRLENHGLQLKQQLQPGSNWKVNIIQSFYMILVLRHLISIDFPSYKWINPTYTIYNWGHDPLVGWATK
jgi:hypothetical protein